MGRGLIALVGSSCCVAARDRRWLRRRRRLEHRATSSLSKEEFIKQGRRDLHKGQRTDEGGFAVDLKDQHKRTSASRARPSTKSSSATVLVPSVEQEIKELRALGVPSGDEEQVDAMLDGARRRRRDRRSETQKSVTESSDADLRRSPAGWRGEYGLEGLRQPLSRAAWLLGQSAAMLRGRWT